MEQTKLSRGQIIPDIVYSQSQSKRQFRKKKNLDLPPTELNKLPRHQIIADLGYGQSQSKPQFRKIFEDLKNNNH